MNAFTYCLPPFLFIALVVGATGRHAAGQSKQLNFERDIRPIFVEHCYECHGPKRREAGLRLDVKSAAFAGGDSGKVIVAGKSEYSAIIELVTTDDQKRRMPMNKPSLAKNQIALLKKWIDSGASWPGPDAVVVATDHWSFKPIKSPPVPDCRNLDWSESAIDAFILNRLRIAGLDPSPSADRRTLIRRLSLDLTGLPPMPDQVSRFILDERLDAYERLVDRLLASPHFGERWGRHWLDLARYADSDGFEMDHPRPHAWRWRDWVIDSVNSDLPFNQFTIQQLAGDLLPNASVSQRIATGFHRNTLTNRENGIDKEEFRIKAVVDRVNTTGTVWLGLTIGCAECHSHKFDPISQREYYQLFAFFNNAVDELDIEVRPTRYELDSFNRLKAEHAAKLAELQSALKTSIKSDQDKLRKSINRHRQQTPRLIAHVFTSRSRPRSTHVHRRGDFLDQGENVTAATPNVLHAFRPRDKQPDRLDLAQWIVDPTNPLTPRVAVNQVWRHLFGKGLVTTPDDFGTKGEPPTHPKLLDWLANELLQSGWSRKKLIRAIVLSSTYRQSSNHRRDLNDIDPTNRLLARQNRMRLEAEIVRDQYLAVSGLMYAQVGGPGFRPPMPKGLDRIGFRLSWKPDSGREILRRGMYIFYHRNLAYPMLKTFDQPNSNVTCTRRERSNTPLQALSQLNDELFVDAASALGRRIVADATSAERVDRTFWLCLSRIPDSDERRVLSDLYEQFVDIYRTDTAAAKALIGSGKPNGVTPEEFAAAIALARAIMNLDEFITRE